MLDSKSLEDSLNKAEQKIKADGIKKDDTKVRANILKGNLDKIASKKEIELVKKKR